MSDELIRLQQQFAIYRSEYAILLAGAKECEARAEAAERRVAELEAQLAAQAWRPVTDEEPPQGKNVIGKQYIESPLCIVSLDFDPMDNEWIWQDVDGVSYHYDSINYWRPIEPPRPNPPGHPTPSNSTGLAIGE